MEKDGAGRRGLRDKERLEGGSEEGRIGGQCIQCQKRERRKVG